MTVPAISEFASDLDLSDQLQNCRRAKDESLNPEKIERKFLDSGEWLLSDLANFFSETFYQNCENCVGDRFSDSGERLFSDFAEWC